MKHEKSEVDHATVKYEPWTPESDPMRLKVLGKAQEEAGEYASALARCVVQGIEGCEPQSKKPNKRWLEEEVADLLATASHVMDRLDLDINFIAQRAEVKFNRLADWFDDVL